MREIIFVSALGNQKRSAYQEGTAFSEDRKYLPVLCKKIIGESFDLKKVLQQHDTMKMNRIIFVLKQEQIKQFLKARNLITASEKRKLNDETIADLLQSGVLG